MRGDDLHYALANLEDVTAKLDCAVQKLREAGVCMACWSGWPDPYGCSDCLNTGWACGMPEEAARLATAAHPLVQRLNAWESSHPMRGRYPRRDSVRIDVRLGDLRALREALTGNAEPAAHASQSNGMNTKGEE